MIKKRSKSVIVWLIVVIGILLPWCVGIGMKIYLDSKGLPTWDWIYFLHPVTLVAEVWATLWLAAPSIILGFLAHMIFTNRIPWTKSLTHWEQGMIVIASVLWGAAGSVPVFIRMFRIFDPISFAVPFFYTVLYLDDYLFGLATGVLLASASRGFRKLKQGV